MPTPTIFEGINPRGTQTFIPCKDKAAVAWADAEKSVKKNYLRNDAVSGTDHDVSYTVNTNKSVKANGTANGNSYLALCSLKSNELPAGSYILSTGNPNASIGVTLEKYNGSTWVAVLVYSYSTDNVPFTVDWDGYDTIRVSIKMDSGKTASNITLYPMIRLASIADSTYEPYIPDNTELMTWEANGILGANNLIPVSVANPTVNEVTATVNDDKSITVNTSEMTAADRYIIGSEYFTLKKGSYYFSGNSADNSGISIYMQEQSSGDVFVYQNSYEGVKPFKVDSNTSIRLIVKVNKNSSITNKTVKPMIALSANAPFTPYVMTNMEFMEKAAIRKATLTVDGTIVKSGNSVYAQYNLLTRVCNFVLSLTIGTYANYNNFITGLPKAKYTHTFIAICTNYSRNIGAVVLTSASDGGMYFTGLGQAANFAENDQIFINGSYVISDDVTS